MFVLTENSVKEPTGKSPGLIGVIAKWRAITHQGLLRSQNEDAHWVGHTIEVKSETESASRYLFAVADGLGGHRAGAIASRTALKSVKSEFHKWHGGEADRMVGQAMQKANQRVFCVAQSDPELFQKMQTTLTVVALDQDLLTVGHIGDCRLYRLRDGKIDQLTRDHTMASDLLGMHLISPEQAAQHPGRHQLTRSVGGELFMNVDIVRETTLAGDAYILCSDGLWSELTGEEILATMQENDISSACEKLVRFALRGGAPDNVTAITFRIEAIGTCAAPLASWRTIQKKVVQMIRSASIVASQ